MSGVFSYLIRDCYAVLFCSTIIICFLPANKNYSKKIKAFFFALIALAAVDSVCGAIENYLEAMPVYQPARVFLSWVCYLAGPAIILTILEVFIRKAENKYKWIVAIPEFINILVTTLAFFTNLVFYYDEDNKFTVGPLAFVPRSMIAVYLLLLLSVCIGNFKKKKWESLTVIVCIFFVIVDYINELTNLIPLNVRGITISFSIFTYFLYFSSLSHSSEVEMLNSSFSESERKFTSQMIDQAIETLAYTIDAKDRYTRGHSFRVAKYSRQIAKLHGMNEERCREIYFAGLLHDIGKISISDTIINKAGELTAREYELIKKHPTTGAKILEKMVSYPSLQDGAKYHHERYDGKGYPYGLKGEEIPEIARIIAVADAYDTMTSHRTYRESMDQAYVKQEIWKGMGTQFDPHFAKVMISLIDSDIYYDMREKPGETDDILYDVSDDEIKWPIPKTQNERASLGKTQETYHFFGEMVRNASYWATPSESVLITDSESKLAFTSKTVVDESYLWYAPVAIVYHSRDGKIAGPDYEELAVFMTAGHSWQTGVTLRAKSSINKTDNFKSWDKWIECNKAGMKYVITMKKEDNIIYLNFINELITAEGYVKLPENYSKNVFLSVSGDNCELSNIEISL